MDPFKQKVLFFAIKHLNILEVKLFDLLEALNKKGENTLYSTFQNTQAALVPRQVNQVTRLGPV